jgi:transcriptional regulator with GAF, ATPase, and Fis domain
MSAKQGTYVTFDFRMTLTYTTSLITLIFRSRAEYPSSEPNINMITIPYLSKAPKIQFVGESEAIRRIEAQLACAARSDAKVLIMGETGVGKEVVALSIHQRSARAAAAMVTLNCAGLPDSLLESELFGSVRGSFTGAYQDKPGLLESAHSGTLFLDEVGEMSPRMQVLLLRFLETGELQRVGSHQGHTRVNVRLITATNRDLSGQVVAGAFREDLYFRLNVIRICIPALRDRTGDIPLLVDHFLTLFSEQHAVTRPEINDAAMDVLMRHRWPGNIRELKNAVERIVLRANGRVIGPTDLPADILAGGRHVPAGALNPAPFPDVADVLAARMLHHGESFWSAVYPAFMARDMTRDHLRRLIHLGLEGTNGNYRLLVERFNMPLADYKRFLGFLRTHGCHLPFQKFRSARAHRPARLVRVPTADASSHRKQPCSH